MVAENAKIVDAVPMDMAVGSVMTDVYMQNENLGKEGGAFSSQITLYIVIGVCIVLGIVLGIIMGKRAANK